MFDGGLLLCPPCTLLWMCGCQKITSVQFCNKTVPFWFRLGFRKLTAVLVSSVRNYIRLSKPSFIYDIINASMLNWSN